MAGLDLSSVLAIITGSERVHPATLERFTQRFSRLNLGASVIRPSYGLAEATVYVATRESGEPPAIVRFESESLDRGHRAGAAATAQVHRWSATASRSRRRSGSSIPRRIPRCPPGTVGEIWVHGDNVASGYWHRPQESESTFGASLVAPSAGTPEGHGCAPGTRDSCSTASCSSSVASRTC